MKTFSLGLVALLSLSACALDDEAADTDTDVSAIVGGTATTLRPEVFKVHASGTDCTGVLISSTTFLTAASCVGYSTLLPGTPGTATFVNGTTASITMVLSLQTGIYGPNIAVGRLGSAVAITPATIATHEPVSETVTVLGYGCTTRTVGCSNAARTYKTYFYGAATQNDSYGDNGAPTFEGGLTDNGSIVRLATGWNTGNNNDLTSDPYAYRFSIGAYSSALATTTQVAYRVKYQLGNWLDPMYGGGIAGFTGEGDEAIQVWSNNPNDHVYYQTAGQDYSWGPERSDGLWSGNLDGTKRLEAIKIRATTKVWSDVYETYVTVTKHITYRVYVHGTGWQDWVSDDAVAGTIGQSRSIEALQVIFN